MLLFEYALYHMALRYDASQYGALFAFDHLWNFANSAAAAAAAASLLEEPRTW